MGCDIHIYLESKATDDEQWDFEFEPNGGRNYAMFGIMAGVRGDDCLYQPRGVPADVSWKTKGENILYVSEHDSDGCATREMAERWVREGSSQWIDAGHDAITNPDWHSHSWLSREEFERCVGYYRKISGVELGYDWTLILAAMQHIEKFGRKTRIVFWFDN